MHTKIVIAGAALAILMAGGAYLYTQLPESAVGMASPQSSPENNPNIEIRVQQSDCSVPPTKTTEEITRIAKETALSRPNGGWWTISYGSGTKWNHNPFPDTCVWVVRANAPAPQGADFGSYALDLVFIRDINGVSRHLE